MLEEEKFIDYSNTLSVDNTGSVTLLNGVATGTDFTDRVGRKIRMTGFEMRLVDSNTVSDAIRQILVYDLQSNQNPPLVTDVLATATVVSPYNENFYDRFVIYHDSLWQLNAVSNPVQVFTIKKQLNLPVVFSGTTAVVGSIATGGFYWISLGSNGVGNETTEKLYSRVWFDDV